MASLPAGAPTSREVLDDLGANDMAIRSFRAAGTFSLESPEFESVKKFRGGRILFRRPMDLYVQGNHRVTNMTLFKLISVGPEFLIEFPTSREQSYYQFEGEQFEDVPFSVSPSDIVREMFLPEPWQELGRRQARVVNYEAVEGRATLDIGPVKAPRRRIDVLRLDSQLDAWVVVRNERLREDGTVLAVTTLEDYHELEGLYFPAIVDAWFPSEATRMRFEMRNIRMNLELPDDVFDVRGRAIELNLAAPERIEH